MLAAMLAANNAALGQQVTAWSTFGDSMSSRIKELYVAGKLGTNSAWSTLLHEMAIGLRPVN